MLRASLSRRVTPSAVLAALCVLLLLSHLRSSSCPPPSLPPSLDPIRDLYLRAKRLSDSGDKAAALALLQQLPAPSPAPSASLDCLSLAAEFHRFSYPKSALSDAVEYVGFPGDTWELLKAGHYLRHPLLALRQRCASQQEGSCLFVDIGAHLGGISFLVAQDRRFRVLSFEAQPDLACAIRMTAWLSNLSNVAVRNCYVATGELKAGEQQQICSHAHSRGASRLKNEENSGVVSYAGNAVYQRCFSVAQCPTLESTDRAYGLKLAKIDTEGHDFNLMLHLRAELLQFDVIYAEYFGEEWRPGIFPIFCEALKVYAPTFDLFWGESQAAQRVAKCEDLTPEQRKKWIDGIVFIRRK